MLCSKNPSFRLSTLILVSLSLSIGWGIRGNYGHEFGAMMPGALAGIAVCLFSGREDWRRRVVYFAFCGALGWAFGGSIAYMPVMSYTTCGHYPSQIYGFLVTFATGFLWASLGGAGTAYPAVEKRERLTAIFKPLCWVFAIWTVQYFCEDAFTGWYDRVVHADSILNSDFRQKSPFYWLDSEWLECTTALIALCAFDLWDRRGGKVPFLALYGVVGAAAGFLLDKLLVLTGLMGPLLHLLVNYQGDLTAINPATGQPFDPANLMTNWPQLFFDAGHHLGWIFGLIGGLVVYFRRFGKWRSGASLLMHMTLGSYLTFLILPVFLSNFLGNYGGFRMMPPRGDSWANTLGVLIGVVIYMTRNNLFPVVFAAIVSGFIGGLGFILAQMVKVFVFVPGNPVLTTDAAAIERWAFWRSANWHSICTEQGVGLFYGLGIAVALGLLATRVKPVDEELEREPASPEPGRWTQAFSVAFILNILLYCNMVKMLEDWTHKQANGFRSVPLSMRAPLAGFSMPAEVWFSLFFLLITACTVALLAVHLRRPLAAVPKTWLGKGQLFYLLFLWAIVIGNFTKAVTAFTEQRIATEGMIIVNALIVTFIILVFARDKDEVSIKPEAKLGGIFIATIVCGIATLLIFTFGFTSVIRNIYGDKHDGWGGRNIRFGEQADWRIKPILKNVEHR